MKSHGKQGGASLSGRKITCIFFVYLFVSAFFFFFDFFFVFFFYAYHATKPLLTFLTEVQLLLKLVISKLKLGQMARVQSNAISARRECRLKN